MTIPNVFALISGILCKSALIPRKRSTFMGEIPGSRQFHPWVLCVRKLVFELFWVTLGGFGQYFVSGGLLGSTGPWVVRQKTKPGSSTRWIGSPIHLDCVLLNIIVIIGQ